MQRSDAARRLAHIYETILSTTDDFAYIFDPQGRFLYANARLLKVWDKNLGQIVGKTCHELGYPTWHADMHMREIEEIVLRRIPIRGEVPFTGASGISGIYDYILKPVLNSKGEVEIIVGTTRDVTERKRDEEKLKEAQAERSRRAAELQEALTAKSVSEQRYRFLADTVPQIVWTAKPDGHLDYYNQRWFEYAGTDFEEMQKVGWTHYVHPQDLPEAAKVWQRALETGHDYESEFRLRRASDQTYRWHLVRAFPMKREDGEIVQWVGTCTDIDDQRKLTETMAEKAARLRLYFDSDVIGNIIGDLDGRVYEANDEYLRIVGYSREELVAGKVRWDAITPPEYVCRDDEAIERARRTGYSEPYEKQYRCKNGSLIWVLVGFVIFEQTKTIAFVLDISARKQAEMALQDAQAKLTVHSNELESIVESRTAKLHESIAELEHFSYAIVHDLRAPLRAMEGYAGILQEELERGDTTLAAEYIRRIRIASRRMDHLISDSLNYSKAARQELPLESVHLFQLIDGIIQTYPNLRAEELEVRLAPSLPVVLGNEAALTQCFSNLLGNAVKFRKPGEKPVVTIFSENVSDVQPEGAQVSASPRRVRIWVEDNGVGIPEKSQDRIFGLFQRADKNQEGTGLGLAIVRKVVERMNGKVGVLSEEGKGSRFWVELPALS